MTATLNTPRSVSPGDVVAGKYRVDRVLGEGGMGVVLAATHLQLDQIVAIKLMLPEVLGNQEAVARFLREARAAVRLKGEHTARVLDVGTLDSGAPYIVMEFLDGHDLGSELARRGALPVEEAVVWVLEACEAMAEAHAQGIIHRDLKPANLFLTRRPDGTPLVKVVDFGISKAAPVEGLSATRSAVVMGSPNFMSPEQMRSAKDVDARADVWALGVILYQLVSGHLPFEADSLPELFAKVFAEPPVPLAAYRPELAQTLWPVIGWCLEKERDRRCADVGALARALAPFAPAYGEPAVAAIDRLLAQPHHPRLSTSPAVPVPAATPLPAPSPPAARRSRRVRLVVTLAALVIAGAAAAIVIAMQPGDRTPGEPAPAPPPPPPQPAASQPMPVPMPVPASAPAAAPASSAVASAPEAPPAVSSSPRPSRPRRPPAAVAATSAATPPPVPAAKSRPDENPFNTRQ